MQGGEDIKCNFAQKIPVISGWFVGRALSLPSGTSHRVAPRFSGHKIFESQYWNHTREINYSIVFNREILDQFSFYLLDRA